MDVLTIHIGHQKTGTTALQETFRRNAALLARHGLYYYAKAPTHHALRRPFSAGERPPSESRRLAMFADEIRVVDADQAFISSETFTMLKPQEVRQCIEYMRRFAARVKVLAYVREPLSYAMSAVHQAVRHGRPLAAAMENPSVLRVRDFVEPWSDAVGPDDFTLKPFDREHLRNGDIIDDVLGELGLAHVAPELTRVRSNEALSVLGIHLLDRANRLAEARLPYDMCTPYDRIRGPRFVPPASFQDRAVEKSEGVLRWLEETRNIRLVPGRRPESPPLGLSEEELATLAEVVYTMVRHAYDVRASTAGRVLGINMPYAMFAPRGGSKLKIKLRQLGVLAELRAKGPAEVLDDADEAEDVEADLARLET